LQPSEPIADIDVDAAMAGRRTDHRRRTDVTPSRHLAVDDGVVQWAEQVPSIARNIEEDDDTSVRLVSSSATNRTPAAARR